MLKALRDVAGSGTGDVSAQVAALDWLLNFRPDVKVVNMSVGIQTFVFNDFCDDANATTMMLRDAIDALQIQGVSVIAASGNDGTSTFMNAPACVHSAVSVAASYDNDPQDATYPCAFPPPQADAVACFFNVNQRTAMVAPGVNITSTARGSGSTTKSGTSASAPLVSACAAAIREAAPTLTAFEVELALRSANTIHDARSDQQFPPDGVDLPRLDCLAAIEQVLAGRGLCPLTPRPNCQHSGLANSSVLKMRAHATPARSDTLYWAWRRGAIPFGDFGAPTSRTSYSVCLYAGSSGTNLLNLFAPAAENCGTKPCWTESDFGNGVYKYKDRLLSPSGISSMIFGAGPSPYASLLVKGKGVNLALPTGHVNLPVRVQLVNQETSKCWEATYTTAMTNTTGTGLVGKFNAQGQ